jgi:hypothetical protein
VSAQTQPKRRKTKHSRLDFLDEWQYRIFKVIVFVVFIVYSLEFLDDKTHISTAIVAVWRYLRSLL